MQVERKTRFSAFDRALKIGPEEVIKKVKEAGL